MPIGLLMLLLLLLVEEEEEEEEEESLFSVSFLQMGTDKTLLSKAAVRISVVVLGPMGRH